MNSDAKSGVRIAHLSAPCQCLVDSIQQCSGSVEKNGPFIGESVARFPVDEKTTNSRKYSVLIATLLPCFFALSHVAQSKSTTSETAISDFTKSHHET